MEKWAESLLQVLSAQTRREMEGSRGGLLQRVKAIERLEERSRRHHWTLQHRGCGEEKLADVGP